MTYRTFDGTSQEETIVDGRFSSSGDIALSDGSATQGALYFADDKNTGIYSPQNDGIAFTIGGQNKFQVTEPGNVVITSTAHDKGLEILAGGDNQESRLRIQGKSSGGAAHEWYIGASRSADRFYISNGSSTHFAIIDGGQTLFGHTSSIDTSGYNPKIQVMGTDAHTSSIAVGRFSNDGSSPSIHLTKSRNGTIGDHGSGDIHDNDVLGNIFWWGSDSVDYEEVAHIGCKASANFSQTSTPGDLTFWTTSSGATEATEKFRVRSTGRLDQYIYSDAIGLNQWSSGDYYVKNVADTNRSGAGASILVQHAVWNGKDVAAIKFRTGTDTTNKDDGVICFETSSANNITERMRITAAGNVSITDGNLVVPSGHGVNFSAYATSASGSGSPDPSSNLLDDYEEGTWVATCDNSVTLHAGDDLCSYTKIGRQVTVNGQVRVNSDNSNAVFKITSLPFNSADLAEGASRCVGSVRINGIDVTNSTEFIGVNCNNSDGSDDLFFTLNQDNAGTADLLAKADGYVMFTLTYFTT